MMKFLIFQIILTLTVWTGLYGLTFTNPPECKEVNGSFNLISNTFAFIDESANMTCKLDTREITNFSANNFYILVNKNGTNIRPPTDKDYMYMEINLSDKVQDFPNQQLFDYRCFYQISKKTRCFVGSQPVLVYTDYRPTPVEHFHCLMLNWKSMKCWFDLVVPYKRWNQKTYMNVEITIAVGIVGMTSVIRRENWKKNDTWLEISVPNPSLAISEVKINITNIPRNISEVSCFEFDPRIYVKPDAIVDFSHEKNATNIKMTWHHSNTQMPKVFRVRYHSEYDNIKLSEPKTYMMTLSDLWPYTNYTITIDVKPLLSNLSKTGFWSDSYTTNIVTSEDVPVEVPEFWPGYFTQSDEDKIRIYWKPIDKKSRCGVIENYRVTIKHVVPFGEKENITRIIDDIPPDVTSYEILIEPQKKYQIKLTQRTKIGYPKKADSHIYLFPKENRPKVPSKLIIEAVNMTSVLATFEQVNTNGLGTELKELVTYNIVWCKSGNQSPGDCMDTIRRKLFPYNSTSNIGEISINDGSYKDYQFGISATKNISQNYTQYQFGISVEAISTKGWFISSGITWYQNCIYLKSGVPSKSLDLNIPQDVDQREGIYLKWTGYTCAESVGKVKLYILNYCEANKDDTQCKGEDHNKTIPANLKSYNYTLSELTKGTVYLIRLAAEMENGKFGPWSNTQKVLYKKTSETISSENLLLGAVLGGSISFIVVILVVVIYIRHYLRRKEAEVAEINLPEIKRSKFEAIDKNGSGSEVRDSRQPLLKNNHSAGDSGLGGSTLNTNGNSLETNSTHLIQNGGIGYQNKTIQTNGSIPTSVIEESEAVSNNERLCVETSFMTSGMSGETDINSGYTDNISMHSSDSSIDSSDSDSNSFDRKSNENSGSTRKISRDNNGFLNENGMDSSVVDSYCQQAENSIDSYSKQGKDSTS